MRTAVRRDLVLAEAIIEGGLEDLDFLARNLGALDAANQFFGLAAEHAAADEFDPTTIRVLLHELITYHEREFVS